MRDKAHYRSPADLHVHSYFSDGIRSPREIVELAREAGLSAIAISDHDSVSAVALAADAASEAGIEIVPAVELSAEVDSVEVHMLAYFIDPSDGSLLCSLERLRNERVERFHEMVGRLKKMGITVDPDEVIHLAGYDSIGRLHLADYLCRKGYVSSIGQAFARYLGEDSPAYISAPSLSYPDTIALIHNTGGVAVLAHPGVKDCNEVIPRLVRAGLDGIEAFHPKHDHVISNFYSSIASKHGLLVTGGSDAHGRGNNNARIGSVTVPYSCVTALLERAKRYRRAR